MTIFIDSDCKCHVSNPNGTYKKVEAPELFKGKCPTYIEGWRFIPAGETWRDSAGKVFHGEALTALRDTALLDEFQRQYQAQLAAAAAAYAEGVNSI